jgi:elongation factor P
VLYNDSPVSVTLPTNVRFKVELVTDNQSGRKATMDTGLEVHVPNFISTDDVIVVSTSDGKYVSKG